MADLAKYHKTVTLIINFLEEHKVPFKTFEHEAVRTSEEAAKVRPEYSISQGAKALIVRAKMKGEQARGACARGCQEFCKNSDNLNSSCKEAKKNEKQFVQIVVPGDKKFDPKKARRALNAKDIRFATPEEVGELTDGIVPGGVPPFGNLFGLPVYMDKSLLDHEEIIFNAGDRRFSVAITTQDYMHVVQPEVVSVV